MDWGPRDVLQYSAEENFKQNNTILLGSATTQHFSGPEDEFFLSEYVQKLRLFPSKVLRPCLQNEPWGLLFTVNFSLNFTFSQSYPVGSAPRQLI